MVGNRSLQGDATDAGLASIDATPSHRRIKDERGAYRFRSIERKRYCVWSMRLGLRPVGQLQGRESCWPLTHLKCHCGD
jgi:hypothetical protein